MSDPVPPTRTVAPAASRTGDQPSLRALAALPARSLRRGAALLVLAGAAYTAVEVVSYRQTYPDPASRAQLARFGDSVAVRVLQGVPRAVDTVGGFVAWDAGWFLAVLVSVWALLATTRVLRGEEERGLADLVLARPVSPRRLLLVQLAVVGLAVVSFGAAVALTLLALGVGASGAALLGAGLGGVGLTSTALAALAAQVLTVRRQALAVAGLVWGAAFLVRMVGSSAPSREGLLLATPFGWLDRVEPYAGQRPGALLPFGAAVAVLVALALRERTGRDAGAARFGGRDRRAPRVLLLGGPVAFGWRCGAGVLAAWAVGTGLLGVLLGALVPTVTELLEEEGEVRRALEQLGIDLTDPVEGFLAALSPSLALALSLYGVWRLGALRTEESTGRLEHLLVRPVARGRWLAASAASALLAVLLVALVCGAGVWVGAAAAGASLDVATALRPALSALPAVAVLGGLAVLVFGLLPRLTVALPAAVAVLASLLELVGPLLDLPDVVLDLSPFRHLPGPGESVPVGATLVLALVAVTLAGLGAALFVRRDLAPD